MSAMLDYFVEAAREAGDIALSFFEHGAATRASIDTKIGGSPVTEADLLANAALERRLRARFPEAGWLSEETVDDAARLACRAVLIVDPIDGTRGFIAGDPRWAVSIALVADNRPIAGVVHAPALSETYAALRGKGAWLNSEAIHASARATPDGARAGGPKPLLDRLAATGYAVERRPKIPSLAYRLVLVASGLLDIAAASADSHDWDIAAADLIVHEAGGTLKTLEGTAPSYNAALPVHGELLAAPLQLMPLLLQAAARRR